MVKKQENSAKSKTSKQFASLSMLLVTHRHTSQASVYVCVRVCVPKITISEYVNLASVPNGCHLMKHYQGKQILKNSNSFASITM